MIKTTHLVTSIGAMLLLAVVMSACSDDGGKGCPELVHECSWDDTFDQAQCPSMGAFDQCVVYVDQAVECSGNGSSWAKAKKTLQEGVDAAACGALTTSMCPVWQVWITGGTYAVNQGCIEDTIFLRSNVELYGGFAGSEASLAERDPVAISTIVDGAAEGEIPNVNNVFVGQYTENVVLDGLTVRGGAAYADVYVAASGHDLFGGGGLALSDGTFTVRNCTFEENAANFGGAISLWTGTMEISDCTFNNNTSEMRGGAVYLNDSESTISNSTFTGNHVLFQGGGAAFLETGVGEISDCEFDDNHAVEVIGSPAGVPTMGGALALMEISPATVDNCTFTGNTADSDGGAIKTQASDLTMTNCVFEDNETETGHCGAGLSTVLGQMTVEDCTFVNNRVEAISEDYYGRSGGMELCLMESIIISRCVFEDNVASGNGAGIGIIDCEESLIERSVFRNNTADHGAGLVVEPEDETTAGNVTVVHSTFTSNTAASGGADVYFVDGQTTGSLEISSSVLWSQTDPLGWEVVDADPVVSYSDVYGGCAGDGNIDADPLFVDESSGDLHLSAGSPCIDAADPESTSTEDFDGNPVSGTADIGAYEFQGE